MFELDFINFFIKFKDFFIKLLIIIFIIIIFAFKKKTMKILYLYNLNIILIFNQIHTYIINIYCLILLYFIILKSIIINGKIELY